MRPRSAPPRPSHGIYVVFTLIISISAIFALSLKFYTIWQHNLIPFIPPQPGQAAKQWTLSTGDPKAKVTPQPTDDSPKEPSKSDGPNAKSDGGPADSKEKKDERDAAAGATEPGDPKDQKSTDKSESESKADTEPPKADKPQESEADKQAAPAKPESRKNGQKSDKQPSKADKRKPKSDTHTQKATDLKSDKKGQSNVGKSLKHKADHKQHKLPERADQKKEEHPKPDKDKQPKADKPPKNGKQPKSEKDKQPKSDKDKQPKSDKDKQPKSGKDKHPKPDKDKQPKVDKPPNNGKQSKSEKYKQPKSDTDKQPKSDTDKQPKSGKDKQPKSDKGKQPKADKTPKNAKQPKSDKDKQPKADKHPAQKGGKVPPANGGPQAATQSVQDDDENGNGNGRIRSASSIAFYTIVGASQVITGRDLRGRFWEWQLSEFAGNYTLHYISDAPLTINGIACSVLPEGSRGYSDSQFCTRTPETWRHFMKHNSATRWYFRGTHDTFVNLTSLSQVLDDLERRGDPMTTLHFAFNFHEYNNRYYPHGGTGWLFSNFAVRKLHEQIGQYVGLCLSSFDDVALSVLFERMGIDMTSYQTSKFIVTWPNHMLDVIFQKRWSAVAKCPQTYRLCPGCKGLAPGYARTAASIHMHKVPMELAWKVLSETPLDYGVYFPEPNTPTFCRIVDE
jgi:hypothetical protein